MRNVVLRAPITVGGVSLQQWEPGRTRNVDCVRVGDTFYFIPLRIADAKVERVLESAVAVHVSGVESWGPSADELPEQIRVAKSGGVLPHGGKK